MAAGFAVSPAAWSVTPAPIPVIVSNGNAAPAAVSVVNGQPYTVSITITLQSAALSGSDNANISGAQTGTVPAGKRFMIKTFSFYRIGAPKGSTAQLYLNSYTNGAINAVASPTVLATGLQFPGATLAADVYADPGQNFLVNGYRDVAGSTEYQVVLVSGYLVNAP